LNSFVMRILPPPGDCDDADFLLLSFMFSVGSPIRMLLDRLLHNHLSLYELEHFIDNAVTHLAKAFKRQKKFSYMIGALIISTALHSFQSRGVMLNSVRKNGM